MGNEQVSRVSEAVKAALEPRNFLGPLILSIGAIFFVLSPIGKGIGGYAALETTVAAIRQEVDRRRDQVEKVAIIDRELARLAGSLTAQAHISTSLTELAAELAYLRQTLDEVRITARDTSERLTQLERQVDRLAPNVPPARMAPP